MPGLPPARRGGCLGGYDMLLWDSRLPDLAQNQMAAKTSTETPSARIFSQCATSSARHGLSREAKGAAGTHDWEGATSRCLETQETRT